MSAISLKSITGITSITTPAGADNQLTLHTNNTTEAVKLDGAGNFHFHNHLSITGVSTASNFKTGSTNVHSTGVELANINTGGGTATFGGGITVAGAIDANGDLDVDGNLDLPDNTSGNASIRLGNSQDFFMNHNGTHSYIINNTGNLYIRDLNGDVHIQGKDNEESIIAKADGAVELYHNNVKKIETTSAGITVTGAITSTGAVNGSTLIGTNISSSNNISITSDTGKLNLGASNDLQLFHSGSHSYIQDNGTGALYIGSNGGGVYVRGQHGEESIIANSNGSVELYHDNALRLTTTNNGVNVSGSVSIVDSSRYYFGSSNDAYLYHDGSNSHFVNSTGHLLFRQAANSDVVIQTNATDRFRIYNDGVVAIGQSSKSNTVGAGNLDIQGNATSCIIEMGNPFPTWQGGIVPNFRITSTNSGYVVDFESVWGGDNLLHKHLSFAGGNTDVYDGTYNHQIARFDGNGRLMLNSTSITNTYDYLTVKRRASNFGEVSMSVDANTSTSSAANAFIFTKSKHTYWNGLGFQSSHGHIGAIVGMRDATAMNSSHKIRIEMGGTHINQSEVKTWDFQNDGDLSISDGNLVVGTAGHGIDFSARGNAGGMTSELLDHYEEGSWTPSIYPMSSNIPVTYSTRVGQYTRIGNVVYWQFKLQVSNITGNRNQGFGISGFPYNINNTHTQCSGEFYGESWDGEVPTTIKYISNTTRGVCNYYADAMKYYSSSMLDINVSSSMLMGAGHYFV